MSEFDFDGFFDNLDTLDDGMDHGSEFKDGFQPFEPEPSDVEASTAPTLKGLGLAFQL